MRKERFFGLTRMLLLTIVVLSATIPFIQLPLPIQSPVRVELPSVFAPVEAVSEAIPPANSILTESSSTEMPSASTTVVSQARPSISQLLFYGYLAGCLIAFLILLRSLVSVLLLTRKARSIPMEGFRLLVTEREIPAFSFGRWVVISQIDYDHHRLPLLSHEQAHIRLSHFYDLLLLEIVKIVHWFNPVIYRMAKDLKEIHEFQADDYTLTKGIDATQYQLLIIQKGVGSQRFALANSFNHCQIKKRIVMMNKQKPNKVWSWKVAAFLPLLALLLMAFGRKAETGPQGDSGLSSITNVVSQDSTKQWSEADFLSINDLSSLMNTRRAQNWLVPKMAIQNQNGKIDTIVDPYNRTRTLSICEIQMDSKSRIWTNNHIEQHSSIELQEYIRTFFDYQFSNKSTEQSYFPIEINGLRKMMPQCLILILSDHSTSLIDYQRMLNTIGNTILEIRGKYSLEIYKSDYSQLTSDQKDQIDVMFPLIARFMWSPMLRSAAVGNVKTLYIEVRVEGIVISPNRKILLKGYSMVDKMEYLASLDEQTSTLNDLRKEVEKFMENNPNGMFSVLVAKGSSDELLNDVKRVLHDEKASNVGYAIFDPVYSYVEQGPIFPGGKDAFKNWLKQNIRKSEPSNSTTAERVVNVQFIVDSNGNISAVKIPSEVAHKLDTEAEAKVAEIVRSVEAMPDWIPGRQNGVPVRVLYGLSVYY